MSSKWVNVGTKRILEWLLTGRTVPAYVNIGLYTNNLTPVDTTVWTDITECVLPGYARKNLFFGTWIGVAIVDPRSITTYTTTPQTWLPSSGSVSVYGVFILDNSDNSLLMVEPFSAPITFSASQGIAYLPRVTLRSEF